jgi:hypothetical protein
MVKVTKVRGAAGSKAADRKNEEWLAGFRVGLVLADRGMGKVLHRADRVDVFDRAGERILTCRVADLPEDVR